MESNSVTQIGESFGQYEILSKLGAGGMGEVYLASDTKLGRKVAIKILPDIIARDKDCLQRFRREAKILASLNHSNIAAIYGFEDSNAVSYIVLEYVEGVTMMQRLSQGTLDINESLDYAKQLSDALEAAHANGVIHRDLKPGNVMFKTDGSVKVLDFGLARSYSQDDTKHSADAATTPPGPHRDNTLTIPGMIMGTAGYMSPEQAKGEPVDQRSDIFSFGCVLYEMLTGKRLFGGKNIYDSVASTLNDEPDWSLLPNNTPASIRLLLKRCLSKNAKQRLQSIGDARLELDDTINGGIDLDVPESQQTRAFHWSLVAIPWILFGVLTIGWFFLPKNENKNAPIVVEKESWEVALPPSTSMGWSDTSSSWSKVGFSRLIAVSRDGRQMIQTVRDGKSHASLYLKELDHHAIRKVNGTEDARGPFFSPDGSWIAFSTEGGLQKVRLPDGGNPEPICQVKSAAFDGTWLENGTMVFSTDRGLFQVAESGGEPEQLTTLNMDNGETGHHFPHALSDKSILFTLVSDSGRHAAVFSFVDKTWKILARNASDARFDPAGYLVFARNGEILAATYDPDEKPLEVGEPVPIVKDVHTTAGQGGAVVTHFATSNNGMLAFAPAGPASENDSLVWVYPDDTEEGREEEIVNDPGQWMHQRISPTGDRILFNKFIDDGNLDLFIHDIKRNQTQQLTFNGSSYDAEWDPEPNADRVVFMSLDAVGRAMYLVDADFGDLTPKRIADGKPGSRPHLSDWTDNGDTVVYFDRRAGGIWLVDPKPGSKPRQLPLGNSNERWARVSPDGKLIAYVGDENQRREVYVQQYPTPVRRVRVSVKGGGEPLWSPDSKTLFFRQDDSVFESAITLSPTLTAEIPPRRLFSGEYDQAGAGHQHYDIDPHYVTDPDRKRFLMIKHGKKHRPSRLHVIRNWSSDFSAGSTNN